MRRALLLVSLAVLLASPPARANADDVARAQVLFDQAMAASRALDYTSACPKFAASQRLDPRTSTLLNLASCYELNGQTASAWATFKEARASALRYQRAEWAERAGAAVASLEPRLVRLTIHVPEATRSAGLTVTLDGSALTAAEWEQPIPVDPGEHKATWTAPGYETQQRSVTVRTTNQELTLSALARLPDERDEPARPVTVPLGFWTTGRVVGVAAVSLGVAAVAAGSVFGLLAGGKYADAERLCAVTAGDPRTCLPARSPDAIEARNAASDLATASTALFVGGGTLVAGGALLFLTSRPRTSTAVAILPMGNGIAAAGRW